MESTLKKYTLADLQVGMTIKDKEQLSGIFDKVIVLIKDSSDSDYKVAFIGDGSNDESDKIMENAGFAVCPVYNSSIDAEGDIYYEE